MNELRRYLPVEDPSYVSGFLASYYSELLQESQRVCMRFGLPDFVGDALSLAVEKFMSSRIEDRGPRSAISFAMTVLKNTIIDETRRRKRQALLAGGLTGDLDEESNPGAWVPEPRSISNPENEMLDSLELHALGLGFELLPKLLAATHKNVERDLEIVRLRYLDGLSWEEIANEVAIDKAHRQSAARGRELLRGWVHALCGTQPEPDAVNAKYWHRGFEQAMAYREQHPWPPRGVEL